MSKKIKRSRESYLKNWTAAISGPVLILSIQSAQAADESRMHLRDFRAMNQGLDRQTLRQLYRDQVKSNSNPGQFNICPVMTPSNTPRNAHNPDPGSSKLLRADRSFVRNQSMQQNAAGDAIRLANGVNLDLTDSSRDITLGRKLFENISSVDINVGGEKKTLTAGAKVSAAEYVAVRQVLAGLGQKLTVAANGSASGGEVDLSSLTSNNDVLRASNLVVPVNVTTIGDFSKGSDFRLLGDLNNYGTVHSFDADGRGRGGTIRARDILNAGGALIQSDVDLALCAERDLTNLGTITCNGNLTLTAGGSLKNASTVSAQRDLNINAPVINNSGSLSSANGNVNLDGPATAALAVTNTGGRIEALNGAINVRNGDYAGGFNTSVSGGDLLSKDLNLNSGQGMLNVNVKDLTGTVNETGNAAHVYASTDVLNIGKVCLTGDPTFVNDTGSINLASSVQVGENLTIIASDDITTGTNVLLAANDPNQGYDITLIAGANITSTAGGATLDGNASANGGSIILGSGSRIYASPQQGTPNNANSGNVYLYAFAGGAAGSGRVDLASGIVETASANAGLDGNLTIVAGGQTVGTTDVIRLGSYNGTNGVLNGTVNVTTAQPVSTGGAITYDTFGNRTSADQLVASGTVTADAGVLISSYFLGNNVNITAGDYIHNVAGSGQLIVKSVTLSAGGNGIGQETAYMDILNVSGPLNLKAQALAGDVWISYGGTSQINLDSSAGNHHFTLNAPYVSVVATGGISGTGTFNLTAAGLTVDGVTLNFHDILVQSTSGYGLVIDGGTSGGTFTTNAAGSANFTATNHDLAFHNTLNFNGGDVNLTVADGSGTNLLINTGTLSGDTFNHLVMNACNLSGGGTTPNFATVTLNCSCGTIANSTGDVNLANNFVFAGQDLAILAFGNINSTGATLIDVSDPTGTGGNVTLMAGVDFTPGTAGQVQNTIPYTITGTNPAGGSINLGGVNILTSGGTGFASGSVTAIANAGSSLATVTLGSINTSGDVGGNVKVISQGYVTVGDINTNGTSSSGSVTLAAAAPVIVGGPITVQDGAVSGGSFDRGAASGGDVTIKNINAPGATVLLSGALTAADDIGQVAGSSLNSFRLTVDMGSGFTTLGFGASSTDVTKFQATGSGSGSLRLLNELGALDVESVNGPNLTLTIIANANIDLFGNVTAKTVNLTSTAGNVNVLGTALTGTDVSISVFNQISASPGSAINASHSLSLSSNLGLLSSALQANTIGGGFQFLTLTSLNGNIGTDPSNRFVLSQNSLVSIDATASNGSIFLQTNNTQPVLLNTMLCDGTFDFRASAGNGPVTLNSITASSDVIVNVAGNTLQVAQSGDIESNSGNIVITNDGLNKKTDFFNIGNGATIKAKSTTPGLGNVTLTIGPVPVPNKIGKTYNKKTITVGESGGGIVTWGKKKWDAKTGPIAITAKGANVTFSNAYGKKNGIIGSNVTIIADPPVLTVAQASTTNGAGKGDNGVIQNPSSALLTSASGSSAENGTPTLANTIELVSVNNASMAGSVGLSNTVTNMACCNENLLTAGQMIEDDSYLTSYAPLQNEVDAKLCTDFDLGFTNNTFAGVPTMAHSACLTMDNGSACFIPSKDTVVVTPRGTVKISANAIAYLNVDDRQLSVYDLNDHHKGSVIVEVGGRSLTLSPGRHVLVTNETPKQFADINPIESVMHRDVARLDFGNERRLFTSEFSVPSAVQALKPLKALMQSGNDHARHASQGVLKTAAIIMQLSGNGAPYEFHARPRQVALKW